MLFATGPMRTVRLMLFSIERASGRFIIADNPYSEFALKRHVTYCRRRARSSPRSRQKSCVSCTKAKTQCDLVSPQCSRCFTRRTACIYQRTQTLTEIPQAGTSTGIEQVNNRSIVSAPQIFSEDAVILEASRNLNQSAKGQFPTEFLNSAPASPMAKWNPSLDDHTWENSNETSSYGDSMALSSSLTSSFLGLDTHLPLHEPIFTELHNLGSPGGLEIDPVTSLSQAFWPKKIDSVRSWLPRAYLLTTLRSYPEMLLSGSNLPPFIHPCCSRSAVQDLKRGKRDTRPALPEPLAICVSVVQMLKAKNKENSSFVWSTIRAAQDKLSREFLLYNDWETVAALQAVTVYFLLRISADEDTDDANFDILLIQTMVKISLKINSFSRNCATVSDGCLPHWQQWILMESIRRTTTVILLIERLFDIRSGLPNSYCDGAYLRGMLLPCSKKLWKAGDESAWEKEYTSNSGVRTCFRYEDLTNANLLTNSSKSLWESPLDGWLAQMDDFGTLLVAAASVPV